MTSELRCLSVQQPWAWALCAGVKDIENRSWTNKYRGTIVIVASSNKVRVTALKKVGPPRYLPPELFAYGAVVGFVDVLDIEPLNRKLEDNPWAWGPYCWRVDNPRLLPEPIPCKAKLNLYTPDPALASRIRAQERHARRVVLDDLEQVWAEAIRMQSEEGRIFGLIDSYITLGEWPGLLRLTTIALRDDPDNSDLHKQRGLALLEQGKEREALASFDEMLRIDPEDPWGYYFRGDTYERFGKMDEARVEYARVKEIDPDFDTSLGEESDEVDEEE